MNMKVLTPEDRYSAGLRHQNYDVFLMAAGNIASRAGRKVSIHESKVVSVKRRGINAVGICCTSVYQALGKIAQSGRIYDLRKHHVSVLVF